MRTSCVAGDAGDGDGDGDAGDGDGDGAGDRNEIDLAWQQLRTVLSSRPCLCNIVVMFYLLYIIRMYDIYTIW